MTHAENARAQSASFRDTVTMASDISDEIYQDQILPHVSRTFALTIPQLPAALRTAVTNAYLLCRIADTIEDEPALSPAETHLYMQEFKVAVYGRGEPVLLAKEIERRLSDQTLPAERDLVSNMDRVIRITLGQPERQRAAIQRCVALMCHGMPHFQRTASLRGLPAVVDLDEYCYYVAGVVGEMLTELFCSHDPAIARRQVALERLSTSFAQGLQMTNILKDVWEDRRRGACWLPQDLFARHGIDLERLEPVPYDPRFGAALRELIALAHAHLRNALEYTLLIPSSESGIRRFCLWAVGLAVLTLRKLEHNPAYTAGAEVKVTRSAVAATRLLTGIGLRQDWMLRALFGLAARGLPLAPLPEVRLARTPPASLAEPATPYPTAATSAAAANATAMRATAMSAPAAGASAMSAATVGPPPAVAPVERARHQSAGSSAQ
jgi:farnesyl-diphosphate farnesyltransferase